MPRAAPQTPALLQFNCGFARCAVKELSNLLAANATKEAARKVDTDTRAERFRALFHLGSFGIPEGFFTASSSKKPSLFDVRCEAVLDAFRKKWKSQCKRKEYLMTFTIQKWRRLTAEQKAKHSMQNCMACTMQHANLQEAFPGPTFRLTLDSVYKTARPEDEREVTRTALKYMNIHHKVSHSLIACLHS